jgi:hypothetical protein
VEHGTGSPRAGLLGAVHELPHDAPVAGTDVGAHRTLDERSGVRPRDLPLPQVRAHCGPGSRVGLDEVGQPALAVGALPEERGDRET